MTLLRGLKYRLSQSMTDAKVRRGNRLTVSKSNVKYGAMYIGDPEAQEYGGNDPDSWFIFKNRGMSVTFFSTLEGLLHAIQTQLKPLNIYGYTHIYKIVGDTVEPYAEMHLMYSPWFCNHRFYYSDRSVVPKSKSILWVDGKYGPDKEIYAVEDDGKKIRVIYDEDLSKKTVKPTVKNTDKGTVKNTTKTATKGTAEGTTKKPAKTTAKSTTKHTAKKKTVRKK